MTGALSAQEAGREQTGILSSLKSRVCPALVSTGVANSLGQGGNMLFPLRGLMCGNEQMKLFMVCGDK